MTVTAPHTTSSKPIRLRTLRVFFLATFMVSWGIGTLLAVFPDRAEALFGPMGYTNPAFILIVYTPGIVALVLVVRHYGIRGLGRFLRRLTLWRMPAGWWLLLAIGLPAVFYLGAAVKGTLTDPFPFAPWYAVLPAMLPALLIGPIEELGWRGIALPLLQRRLAPLGASLILGGVVAVWHTPAFFLSGTKQSGWSYWPFFVGVVAISVILTAMVNASRGSLLVAVLFHAQVNGPAWPDAQPWDMCLFVLVAVVVVLVNRKAMLSRSAGATVILIDDDTNAARRPSGDGSVTDPTGDTEVERTA